MKHAPDLLTTFRFSHGLDAIGRCYIYGRGQSEPLGSGPLPVGIQQGDELGPLFFALGLDELLAAVLEPMRNLPVNSTFVNQPGFVTGPVEGDLLDGPLEFWCQSWPVAYGISLRLLESP